MRLKHKEQPSRSKGTSRSNKFYEDMKVILGDKIRKTGFKKSVYSLADEDTKIGLNENVEKWYVPDGYYFDKNNHMHIIEIIDTNDINNSKKRFYKSLENICYIDLYIWVDRIDLNAGIATIIEPDIWIAVSQYPISGYLSELIHIRVEEYNL